MSNPHPTVTLSREHRNAIRDHITGYFDEAADLAELDRRPEYRELARQIIWRLSVSERVLDQIGWQPCATGDTYTLEPDSGIMALLDYIDKSAHGTIEDNRGWLSPRDPGSPYTPEEYEDGAASARRMIDVDLDAIDAVRLVREATTEAK
jgi:hypothetical protein